MTDGQTPQELRLNISPSSCRDTQNLAEFLARQVAELPPGTEKRNASDTAKSTVMASRVGDCQGKLGNTEGGLVFLCGRTEDCGANRSVDSSVFLPDPKSK